MILLPVSSRKWGEKLDGQTATLNREGAHPQTTRPNVLEDKLQFLVKTGQHHVLYVLVQLFAICFLRTGRQPLIKLMDAFFRNASSTNIAIVPNIVQPVCESVALESKCLYLYVGSFHERIFFFLSSL
jgi:hypothetical protein